MKRPWVALALCLASPLPLAAFQHETTNDPQCTENPGVNCQHLGTPFFWAADKLPVRYFVNSDLSGLDFSTARDAIDRAFTTWQNASSNGITFGFAGQSHTGSDGRDGRNTVSWQKLGNSGNAFVSDTFAQSIITFQSATGEIVDVDTELNADFPFAVLPSGEDDPSDPRVDIQAVVTHEVGHLLGLAHENRMGSDIVMFFSDTSGDTRHRVLTADDRNGVRAIYPSGSSSGGGGGGCAVSPSGHDTEIWPVALLLLGLVLGRRVNRVRARRRAPSTDSRPSHAGCVARGR